MCPTNERLSTGDFNQAMMEFGAIQAYPKTPIVSDAHIIHPAMPRNTIKLTLCPLRLKK
jgi:adenine-specific DNA glycosylase